MYPRAWHTVNVREYLWHICEWMNEWEKECMTSTSFLHATSWGHFIERLSEARVTNCGFVGLTSCSPGDTMRAGLRFRSTEQLWAGIPARPTCQVCPKDRKKWNWPTTSTVAFTYYKLGSCPVVPPLSHSLPCVLPWRTWISKPLVGPILEHSSCYLQRCSYQNWIKYRRPEYNDVY